MLRGLCGKKDGLKIEDGRSSAGRQAEGRESQRQAVFLLRRGAGRKPQVVRARLVSFDFLSCGLCRL